MDTLSFIESCFYKKIYKFQEANQMGIAQLEEHTHFGCVKDKCTVSSFDQRRASEELTLQSAQRDNSFSIFEFHSDFLNDVRTLL